MNKEKALEISYLQNVFIVYSAITQILVINSERAAMLSPDFKGKMVRTNKQILEDLAKDFIARYKLWLLNKREDPKQTKQSRTELRLLIIKEIQDLLHLLAKFNSMFLM